MRFTPHQNLAANASTASESGTGDSHGAAGGGGSNNGDGDGSGGSGGSGDSSGGGGGGGFGVWLPPRSLLLFTGEVYSDFLHGIQDVTEDAMDDTAGDDGEANRGWMRTMHKSVARFAFIPEAATRSLDGTNPWS
jgi:hypothetical protein